METHDLYAVDEDEWPDRDIYEEVTWEQESINMQNLLMMCMIPDFPGYTCTPVVYAVSESSYLTGNYRLCYIFRDGYVYCMNEYHITGKGDPIYYLRYNDEMWKNFKDIYCVGRLSSDCVHSLCAWIDDIEIITPDKSMYQKIYPEIDNENISITVFRTGFPNGRLEISYASYIPDPFTMSCIEVHRQEGFECLIDESSHRILDWLLSSSVKENWNKQISETGQIVAVGEYPGYPKVPTNIPIVVK